jgi:hypothetical protein
MGTFYLYLGAVAGHWLAFMSAGPFVVDQFLQWLSPSVKEKMDAKLQPRVRRRIEVALMIIGVFLAGFFAFQDERDARLAAEHKASSASSASRLEVSTVAMDVESPQKADHYILKLSIINKGALAAYEPMAFADMRITAAPLSKADQDRIVANLREQAKAAAYSIAQANQMQPGSAETWALTGMTLSVPDHEDILNKKKFLWFYAILKYADETLADSEVRITEFCGVFTNSEREWGVCYPNRIYTER